MIFFCFLAHNTCWFFHLLFFVSKTLFQQQHMILKNKKVRFAGKINDGTDVHSIFFRIQILLHLSLGTTLIFVLTEFQTRFSSLLIEGKPAPNRKGEMNERGANLSGKTAWQTGRDSSLALQIPSQYKRTRSGDKKSKAEKITFFCLDRIECTFLLTKNSPPKKNLKVKKKQSLKIVQFAIYRRRYKKFAAARFQIEILHSKLQYERRNINKVPCKTPSSQSVGK